MSAILGRNRKYVFPIYVSTIIFVVMFLGMLQYQSPVYVLDHESFFLRKIWCCTLDCTLYSLNERKAKPTCCINTAAPVSDRNFALKV